MQEAEQKTMLEHEKLKISELAEQVEQERVAAENAKATAEAEITDELKKARKILGCASHIASVQGQCCLSSLAMLRRYKPTDKAKMKKTSSRVKSKRAKGAGGQGKSSGDDDSASTSTQG